MAVEANIVMGHVQWSLLMIDKIPDSDREKGQFETIDLIIDKGITIQDVINKTKNQTKHWWTIDPGPTGQGSQTKSKNPNKLWPYPPFLQKGVPLL